MCSIGKIVYYVYNMYKKYVLWLYVYVSKIFEIHNCYEVYLTLYCKCLYIDLYHCTVWQEILTKENAFMN